MYNKDIIEQLTQYIFSQNGIADKALLQSSVQQKFHLIKERSVFYCEWFSIRFCKAATRNFGNTVLSLSVLHRYDDRPFFVCLVTPARNYLMLANATFLKKISHSSQALRREKAASMAATSCVCLKALKILLKTLSFFIPLMKTILLKKILSVS